MSESYDKLFEVFEPGACLMYLSVFVNKGIIQKCEIKGQCEGNLKVLAQNLTNEKLENVFPCIDECCASDSNPCVTALRKTLKCIFERFIEEYK